MMVSREVELKASPVEGQSLQQTDKNRRTKRKSRKIKKREKPEDV